MRTWSKAGMLRRLQGKLKLSHVEPLLAFKVEEWSRRPDAVLARIRRRFPEGRLAVRSSSANEDTPEGSNAGRFASVLDVPSADERQLRAAVEKVRKSFAVSGAGDAIFVQRYVGSVTLSGVLFTRDLDTFAPYFVVSYDDRTGRTDTVTSGSESGLKTYIRYKGRTADDSPRPACDARLERLFAAGAEIERLLGIDYLDIEFAFDRSDRLVVFQVRRLVPKCGRDYSMDGRLEACLRKAYKKLRKMGGRRPQIYGDRSMFGVMPDWNPAEIIGVKPRRLAISLYKELVTDSTWAYQRDNYGYVNMRSFPLLLSVLGVPFIDVRVSFNSFVPKGLDPAIADKLVNYYLDRLEARPASHDKVEFDIVFSCYYLGMAGKLAGLRAHGFNENEIKRIEFSLLSLTNSIIDPASGLYRKDIEKVRVLEEKHARIMGSKLSLIEKIYWLVEYCKRFGTLPFAGVARSAFIAVQILRSIVAEGILSGEEYNSFMNSLNTVAKRLNRDFHAMSRGRLAKDAFLARYGHLRPGTYDILSYRYDERFDLYFHGKSPEKPSSDRFRFRPGQLRRLDASLREQGFEVSAAELLGFIRSAIEGREYAKFVFTRTLSEILRLVCALGQKCDLGREDLSYLDIGTVLGMYATLDHRDLSEILSEDIAKNRAFESVTSRVKLPGLITRPESIYSFALEAGEPNYVTQRRVAGPILTESKLLKGDPGRKIIFIKAADPGYDWIFSKKPTGLVTMYGGANSHMAIRCAELGIPAVIGAGERNYMNWSQAHRLEIDAMNRTTTILA